MPNYLRIALHKKNKAKAKKLNNDIKSGYCNNTKSNGNGTNYEYYEDENIESVDIDALEKEMIYSYSLPATDMIG